MTLRNATSSTLYTPAYSPADDIDVSEIFIKITRNKWLILAFGLAFMALTLVYSMITISMYEADAVIRIETVSDEQKTGTNTDTEIEIMRSWSVVNSAVEAMGASVTVRYQSPFYSPLVAWWSGRKDDSGWAYEPYIRINTLNVPDTLKGQALTLIVKGEGRYSLYDGSQNLLLEGEVESQPATSVPQPKERGRVTMHVSELEALPGTRIRITPISKERYVQQLQQALTVKRRGNLMRSDVVELAFIHSNRRFAEDFLSEVVKAYIDRAYDRKSQGLLKSLAYLENQLENNLTEIDAAEQKLEKFREHENYIDLSKESDYTLQQTITLQSKITELKMEEKNLSSFYTENHPVRVAMQEQLEFLESELQGLEQRIARLPKVQRQLLQLTRDVDALNRLYVFNYEKINQLYIESAGIVGYAKLIDPAKIAPELVWPKTQKMALVGLLLGLFLGVSISLLRDSVFFAKATSGEQLKQILGIPVFATIPYINGNSGKVKGSNGKSPVRLITDRNSKAFKTMQSFASKVDFIIAGAANKVIAISSDVAGPGKSFVAVNFATLCAATHKVVLVDCNLAAPALNTIFDTQLSPGLSDAIIGKHPIDDTIKTLVPEKLWLVPAGVTPPNEGELLAHPNFPLLMQELAQKYDIIIIDYPHIDLGTMHPSQLQFAGSLLLVVSYRESLLRIKYFLSRFTKNGGKVSGLILNNVAEGKNAVVGKFLSMF